MKKGNLHFNAFTDFGMIVGTLYMSPAVLSDLKSNNPKNNDRAQTFIFDSIKGDVESYIKNISHSCDIDISIFEEMKENSEVSKIIYSLIE